MSRLNSTIKNIPEEENALARQLLQTTAENIVKDRASGAEQRKSDIEKSFRIFGEKEIMQVPKAFRKEFRTEGCTAHIRKRKSGKTHWNYEVRYIPLSHFLSIHSNVRIKKEQRNSLLFTPNLLFLKFYLLNLSPRIFTL